MTDFTKRYWNGMKMAVVADLASLVILLLSLIIIRKTF